MAAKSRQGPTGTPAPADNVVEGDRGALDWDDVRVLLALTRHRTLRAAAEALRVNASTVGRRLETLEAALGTRLFDRTQDGLMPTAAAEQLVAHAERVEQAAFGLVSAAEGFERAPEGVVRLTAPPGVADHFVAPALPRLIARYPGLRIELDASIGYSDLTRREADLALRISPPDSSDLIARKLVEDPDVLVGTAGYVAELGTLERPGDARFLSWGNELALLPSARWISEHVPERSIVLRSNSINALLAAAESGLGVLLISKTYVQIRPLVPVQLAPKLDKELAALPSLPLWLVGHRALREVPRIAAVWEFIVEEIARSTGREHKPAKRSSAASAHKR